MTSANAKDRKDFRDAVLRPGRNCRLVAPADRAAFLVDGDAYFTAFHEAVSRARSTVYIAGWDLDSRLVLRRDGRDRDAPATLGDFLNLMARTTPGLHIQVLVWDFAMIYALEREPLFLFRLGWKTPRRVRTVMDGETPLGSSHHQKLVVVDDKVAFCGGLDLTARRWDTREHAQADPRRTDPGGNRYGPFHDVQMAVDGPASKALGDVFRQRWRWATGRDAPAPGPVDNDPWPPGLAPDMEGVAVAVARTVPAFKGREEICEVKALYLDSIAAARHSIYIENQYFTSSAVESALAARLGETDGPEVVMVLPRGQSGWLEEGTMGVLRANILARLRAADVHGRLRVYWLDGRGGDGPVTVHSKVMVVDDRLVRIGSSNLNNRSMGLDTECDVAVEAAGANQAGAVAALRNGLLAEHLDTEPERVARAVDGRGSLVKAVDELASGGRLRPLRFEPSDLGQWVEEAGVLDPERPVALDRLMDDFVEDDDGPGRNAGYVKIAAATVLMVGLAAAWRFTPLGSALDMDTLVAWGDMVRDSPAAPLWVLWAFVAGSSAMFPVTALVAATAMAFPPWQGFGYALAGVLSGAAATYGLGRMAGRNTVRRLAGRRLNRLSRRLARQGVVAVTLVRLVPLAPFSVVNMVAGASRIGLRTFLAGTMLGMAPGVAMLTILAGRIRAAAADPNWLTMTLAGVVLAVFGAAAWYLRRRLRRHGVEPDELFRRLRGRTWAALRGRYARPTADRRRRPDRSGSGD